jgi:hypothetical protein
MLFDNLQREKVFRREDYLCFFCPAYRSSPVREKSVAGELPALLEQALWRTFNVMSGHMLDVVGEKARPEFVNQPCIVPDKRTPK